MALELITEVANSHQGNIKLLKKIVTNFYRAGAETIKFQIYFAEDFLTKNHERFLHFKNNLFQKKNGSKLLFLQEK